MRLFSTKFELFFADTAFACPLCHSNTADDVRAGIAATAQDAEVLLALLGPFAVLGLVLAVMNQVGERASSKKGDH
jgi:hypothetical protein